MACQHTLGVWDADENPWVEFPGIVYSWNGHTALEGQYSLLSYVEAHGERLRKKYLAFTHELGQTEIHGKRCSEHLVLKGGLNYWWMTLLVEKHFQHFPLIDAIRLIALEELLIKHAPQQLIVASANVTLHRTLKALCQALGIDYQRQKLPPSPTTEKRKLYDIFPKPLQALLTLIRCVRTNRKFVPAKNIDWFPSPSLFVCGYFANVNEEQAERGIFQSRYWGSLHNLLQELGLKVNWLHHNVHYPETAVHWINSFNQNKESQGFHHLLESYLSWRVIFKTIKKWFELVILSLRFRQIKRAFRVQGSALSLWPLMKKHWINSLRGPLAVTNLLMVEWFESAFQAMPFQKLGLYLCENHPWEQALLYAWKKHGHGQLVGVAHATIRFWDLRYFFDPRMLQQMPRPHLIALNSDGALKAYRDMQFPKKELIACEALRYTYLNAERGAKTTSEFKQLLILGDILFSTTDCMLKLLEAVASSLSPSFCLTLKPHPVCPINVADYPRLALNLTTEPLERILHNYDVAYASDSTSAAVDAYYSGLSVVVFLDHKKLNFSPLRGYAATYFVSHAQELLHCLNTFEANTKAEQVKQDLFFLDSHLPRWRKLLEPIV
jgi:surface carbohydrate biosynthesis protein (TIGR04326 family)